MSPEEGGSWFFLLIDGSVQKGLIIDAEKAKIISNEGVIDKLKADGISIVVDENGAWKAFSFDEDFTPYSVPSSVQLLAPHILIGTVITLDNGCMPSVEWRFKENEIEVFDTFDYAS